MVPILFLFSVMHTCFLISTIEANAEILSPLKVFSTVLSGLCHDVGHTGRTNSFEIASRSKKALTYNDLSVIVNLYQSHWKISMSRMHLKSFVDLKTTFCNPYRLSNTMK